MLNLPGRYCDGINRRSFLKIGGLAMGGLSLPSLFQAEAQAGTRRSHKSVIMVYLSGGLAHQDTVDLKPHAPAEIKGEFKPIQTNVSGIELGEHLPQLAKIMDKMTILRSLVGLRDEHSSFHTMTGYGMDITKREHKPHVGGVIAKMLGQTDSAMPAFIDLFPTMQHKPYNSPGIANLGRGAMPAKVESDDLAVMKLTMPKDEFAQRRELWQKLEGSHKDFDAGGLDVHYQKAFDVLTSSKLMEALDVEKEPVAIRDRYGRGSPKHQGDGAPQWNDQLLQARRLVEAGARVVTVAYGFWDTHGQNFSSLKSRLPLFDKGISALIEDIHARGMDQDTTVVVWGEFGRTPKINKDAGRDHWARVNSAILAGGGMKTGQAIGSTDSIGGEAKDNPIHYLDVLASIYQNMGIDPHAMVYDVSGRPSPILPSTVQPIGKLY